MLKAVRLEHASKTLSAILALRGDETDGGRMYLGVEIGGTKLQVGAGAADGVLSAMVRRAVAADLGREGILRRLEEMIPECLSLLQDQKVLAIGVGFGGPVDSAAGRVVKSHQVQGWDGFTLAAWFNKQFGLPTFLGNDSDLAGWAEALFGAGKGASPVVYMNIGSGVGGALIVDGALYAAQGLGSAEIGHLRLAPGAAGEPWRTLEDLASGWALDAAARELATADPNCLTAQLAGEGKSPTAANLVGAARRGDQSANGKWRSAVEFWGVAIANVVTLFCPQRVVLGGGVALVGDFLLEPLRNEVRRQVFAPFRESFTVVAAGLGEAQVVHGALRLAAEQVKKV